jgi:hypothetical protein
VEKSGVGSVKSASKGRANHFLQSVKPPKKRRGREKTAYGTKVRRLLSEGKTPSEVFAIVGGNKQAIYNIKYRMKSEPKRIYIAPARAKPKAILPEAPKLSMWQRFKQWVIF